MLNRNFSINSYPSPSERLPLTQYQVELYKGKVHQNDILFTTRITLFLGEIICSGMFPPENVIYDFARQMVEKNERCRIKAVRVIERFMEEDIAVLIERTEYV